MSFLSANSSRKILDFNTARAIDFFVGPSLTVTPTKPAIPESALDEALAELVSVGMKVTLETNSLGKVRP